MNYDKRQKIAAAIFSGVIAVLSLFPFTYHRTIGCPAGGTFIDTGKRVGLPFSHISFHHSSDSDCVRAADGLQGSQFSVSALFTDLLIVGLIAVGANVLIERWGKRA